MRYPIHKKVEKKTEKSKSQRVFELIGKLILALPFLIAFVIFMIFGKCQCFWYFDHEKVMPKLCQMLKPGGKLLVLYMAWLPYEDYIAGKSEELVLKYSPVWSGAREKMHPIQIPDCYNLKFNVVYHEEYTLNVHFTRETWNGRMKACRGVGASLSDAELQAWEEEHLKMLSEIAPEEFDVKHYAALAELQVKK